MSEAADAVGRALAAELRLPPGDPRDFRDLVPDTPAALRVRVCPDCGRSIRGPVFFRHRKRAHGA